MVHLWRWGAAAALSAVLIIGPSTSCFADLIAEDSFEFGTGTTYQASSPGPNTASNAAARVVPGANTGQNPSTPFGFAGNDVAGDPGAWQGTQTALVQIKTSNLTYPGHATSGGSLRFDWDDPDLGRQQFRNLAAPPSVSPGGEFWMSGMVRLNGASGSDLTSGYAWMGFASDTVTSTGVGPVAGLGDDTTQGWRIGVQGDGSEMDLVFRHQAAGGGSATSTVLQDGVAAGADNLVFIRGVADGGTGTNDLIQIWLNPDDISTPNALGSPDFTLEDESLQDSNAFNSLVFQGYNLTGGGANFDEFRLGMSFLDVAPNATIPPLTPEPGSFLLFGTVFALAGLWWRRKRH